MNYKVIKTWANGFYSQTRRYKLESSALERFLLDCDMLTNTVELYLGDTLLANKEGYRHGSIKGKKAKLLTVGGKRVEVTL